MNRQLFLSNYMDLNEEKHTKEDHSWKWFTDFAGIGMCHNYYIHHIISDIFKENKFQLIVELGAFRGSMSVICGLHGVVENIPVYSYDIEDIRDQPAKILMDKLGVKFVQKDIFANRQEIIDLIKDKKTYLICDNGYKKDEFIAFGSVLPSGSVISAHDWNVEIHPEDVAPLMDRMIPFKPEQWMQHNSQFASWVVK